MRLRAAARNHLQARRWASTAPPDHQKRTPDVQVSTRQLTSLRMLRFASWFACWRGSPSPKPSTQPIPASRQHRIFPHEPAADAGAGFRAPAHHRRRRRTLPGESPLGAALDRRRSLASDPARPQRPCIRRRPDGFPKSLPNKQIALSCLATGMTSLLLRTISYVTLFTGIITDVYCGQHES